MSTPNFVHDLVEMAKAVETLPRVQQENQALQKASIRDGETIARLETKLIEHKSEMDNLYARIRELEVARDDAEMRFLEADDRISAFKKLVGTFQNDTADLVKSMEPVVPEPVVTEPEPVVTGTMNYVDPTMGQSEIPPTPASPAIADTIAGDGGTTTIPSESGTPAESPEVAQPDPIASSYPTSPSSSAPTGSAENQGSVGNGPMEEPKGKYWGKLYRDVPGFVSLHDWLANGGTERDYHAMSRY